MPVTLRDIAKHLNLSHATVSFVLNERHDVAIPDTTRQRVWQAARDLGYRPNRAARALVMGRTQMVALWLPSPHIPYYGEIFRSLYSSLHDAGYDTIFCQARFDNGGKTPFDWPVDGVIAVDAGHLFAHTHVPDYMPLVNLGTSVDARWDNVTFDMESGTSDSLQHLRSKGCRRIACVATESAFRDEIEGDSPYDKWMRDRNLEPEWIVSREAAREAIRTRVSEHARIHGAPDGLLCQSDWVTMPALRGLADVDVRVPEDCRVVCLGGTESTAYAVPDITAVVHPLEEMARLGVDMLLGRLKRRDMPARTITIPTRLVERESSAVPVQLRERSIPA